MINSKSRNNLGVAFEDNLVTQWNPMASYFVFFLALVILLFVFVVVDDLPKIVRRRRRRRGWRRRTNHELSIVVFRVLGFGRRRRTASR
jgi:hypothetical protein